MELLLIRHAEPVRIELAEGPADPDLHERGNDQAARLATWLRDEPLDAVWSSPMRRAVQTAAPLAEAVRAEIQVDDRLAEFDREATSYIPVEELKALKDERWLAMARGEFDLVGVDPETFRRDVVACIEHLIDTHQGRRVAVVCHGGVINTYVGHVLGIDRPLWFEPRYTSVTRIAASRAGIRSVLSLNNASHLRGLPGFEYV